MHGIYDKFKTLAGNGQEKKKQVKEWARSPG